MKKLFLLILTSGIMLTACKKNETLTPIMQGKSYIYDSKGITIVNPNYKLIDDSYSENGCYGKLYKDENNPIITYFEIIKSSKALLYEGKYNSQWVGDKYVVSCSACDNCQKDCRVDAVLNEKGEIIAVRITRIVNN